MDKESINERFIMAIGSLLQDKGLTKAGIAASLGVKPAKFSEILNSRMMAGTDMIAALCEKYSFSATWVLTGEGPMLVPGVIKGRSKPTIAVGGLPGKRPTKNELKHKLLQSVQSKDMQPAQNPQEGIPLIPFSAMAGALSGELTALEYECERYVVPAFKGADFLMPIKGVSMQPTYLSGDIVACQRVPMTSIFFQWNKPYVLDTAQGALVKRIRPGSDKEHVSIVSDNPEYTPFELPVSEIHAVALVIGLIRLE